MFLILILYFFLFSFVTEAIYQNVYVHQKKGIVLLWNMLENK